MNNKEDIFQQLLAENKDKIYRICYAYLYDRSEVEDLYQDILLNIWNNLDRFRKEAKMSTWVYRISVNTALIYNKKRKRKQKLFIHGDDSLVNHPAESKLPEVQQKEKALEKLAYSINQLEKQDRLMISLLLEGMAYKEIAEVMGTTTNFVGVRLNRIKKKLNKLMKTQSYGI